MHLLVTWLCVQIDRLQLGSISADVPRIRNPRSHGPHLSPFTWCVVCSTVDRLPSNILAVPLQRVIPVEERPPAYDYVVPEYYRGDRSTGDIGRMANGSRRSHPFPTPDRGGAMGIRLMSIRPFQGKRNDARGLGVSSSWRLPIPRFRRSFGDVLGRLPLSSRSADGPNIPPLPKMRSFMADERDALNWISWNPTLVSESVVTHSIASSTEVWVGREPSSCRPTRAI